jgi:hypothetical protein
MSWAGGSWSPTTEERGLAPDSYPPPPLPADLYGDKTYLFAFWSVNGLSLTGIPFAVIPDGQVPFVYIGGGSWVINANAWYLRDRNSGEGGDGPKAHGVEIDAFSSTINDFIANDFVDIGPDGPADLNHPGLGSLTYTANEDGYISTDTLIEPITIKARGQFEDEDYRYQFSHWEVIRRFTSGSPVPVVNDSIITVHPQNTLKAYAIYQQSDRVTEDVQDPGKVEDVLRGYALYDRAGRPFIFVGPLGNPRAHMPLEDVRRLVEMLQQAEKNLHEPFKIEPDKG